MESRNDFLSIQPILIPLLAAVCYRSASISLQGTDLQQCQSGQLFAIAVADLRNSLQIASLHPSASLGFSLYFDDLMSKNEAEKWFGEVLPRLADLLLRLPALLETHYQSVGSFNGMETGLRLLESQQSGS